MARQSPDGPHHPDPLRVVVADDHPAVLDAVVRFLELEEGIEVVGQASRGERALRLIEQRGAAVAVLDIRMPGLNGIELTRRLVQARSTAGVILYTGHADRGLLLEALDVGARGFVLKEAPLDDLVRAIRFVAAGETYIDPALSAVVAGGASERLPALTKREREILRMLADGMRNEQVARSLSISPLTVRSHVKNAMVKLDADTRTQAVARALRESLIT